MAETDSAANQFGAPESVEDPRHISVVSGPCLPLASFVGSLDRRVIMSTFDTLPGESNTTSSRRSLTWSVHNAGEECQNSNVKGDAAETGLQNGNGRIRPPEAPNPSEATPAGRCGELLYFCDAGWKSESGAA